MLANHVNCAWSFIYRIFVEREQEAAEVQERPKKVKPKHLTHHITSYIWRLYKKLIMTFQTQEYASTLTMVIYCQSQNWSEENKCREKSQWVFTLSADFESVECKSLKPSTLVCLAGSAPETEGCSEISFSFIGPVSSWVWNLLSAPTVQHLKVINPFLETDNEKLRKKTYQPLWKASQQHHGKTIRWLPANK